MDKPFPASHHPAYRPDIDGLRAVAILSVLGFHAFPAWFPGGFIGVDVFFVISGFLISGILLGQLETGRFSLVDFYARRVRRIFPALILVLAVVLGFGYATLWPDEYRRLGQQAAGGAGFVSNLLLWRHTGYFDIDASTKPLLHLWSLGVEEQFYIFWPMMLALAWRGTRPRRIGGLLAGVGLASLAINLILVNVDPVADFYSPFSRFWELLAGGCLAWRQRQATPPFMTQPWRETASALGLILIVASVFLLDKAQPFPGALAMLPVAGAFLLIACGGDTRINRYLLANPVMVWVGLISYPLYLWHWPLLSFGQILSGEPPERLVRMGLVAASFVLAGLTHALVEKPIRSRPLCKTRTMTLAALLLAVGLTGILIYTQCGMPSRLATYPGSGNALNSDTLIAAWQDKVRSGQCHFREKDMTERADSCIEAARPLVFLWGDSHAASLYPGLRTLQNRAGFGIAQMTQGGCPPFFDVPKPVFRRDCVDVNRRILDDARRLKPELILLDAAWAHSDYPMEPQEIVEHLRAAITILRDTTPSSRILVVGPMPRWLSPLPSIYRRSIMFDHRLPAERTSLHLDPSIAPLDALMRDGMARDNIPYVSPVDVLCSGRGCLTRLGEGAVNIAYLDQEHMTAKVSDYLVARISGAILAPLGIQAKEGGDPAR